MEERKDMIYRQAAIDATWEEPTYTDPINALTEVRDRIKAVPSVQPDKNVLEQEYLKGWEDGREKLSHEYTKAVFSWLLDYQIKAAELKGRYTPYEVLSWVANDWRKENR